MPQCNEDDIVSLTTTVARLDDARRLAAAIVKGRLAACAQIEPVTASIYWWDGKLCDEPEVRLTLKTTRARLGALQECFAREHPYEVPQFIAVACIASDAYAGWVRAQTGG